MDGYRHENKYYISTAGYQMLRGRLQAALETDPNTVHPDGKYMIRSLYFDDYCQTGLLDKVEGIEDREKFRIRFYDMRDDFIRLEAKQKRNNLTKKLSARLTRPQVERILAGDTWFLYDAGKEQPLLRNFYYKCRTRLLRPAVIVDYYREAYIFQDVRLTFDMDLATGNYRTDLFSRDIRTIPFFPSDRVILEVKFDDDLPFSVRQLLRPIPATRCAISKYELCRQFQ